MTTERDFKWKQSEFFDTLSRTFLRKGGDSNLLPTEYRNTVSRALLETFPRDFRGRIIDVGTGMGQNALEIASRCHESEVIAIDISIESLRQARAAARTAGISPRIDFVLSDNEHLPFRPGVFNASMVIGVLHHSYDPVRALAELLRVTTGGAESLVIETSMANILRKLGWLFWDCIPPPIKDGMQDVGENGTLPDIVALTPKNLKRSLEAAGWEITKLESEWLFIFLVEYLAALEPLRKLFAYRLVRIAQLIDRRLTQRGPFQLAGSFMIIRAVNPRGTASAAGEPVS